MDLPPSGEQFELSCGEHRATVVEVGGGLREYYVGDRPVLDPYPIGEMCDGAHGAVLIPWPNRLADGRYRFDGRDHQLPITEPDRHNAIHGLLRWRPWLALERTPELVAMNTRLYPQPGYPFSLEVTVEYSLSVEGLEVATTALNIGSQPCPYGAGQHPYLSPGEGLIDDCLLEIPAQTLILTDPVRRLPTGRALVEGTELDFRRAGRIGKAAIDAPVSDLARDPLGRGRVRLTGPDGGCVELWVDSHYSILQVYTGDKLSPSRRRRGLGLEPMTCPPNAFQSGEELIRLEPGQSLTTRWGVALTG